MHYSKQGLFHLDDVPFSQFPPGGDPHVITVQLHHGCRDEQRMCVCERTSGRTCPPIPGQSRALALTPEMRKQAETDRHAARALLPSSRLLAWRSGRLR